ncbi:MAG: methyltransferase domain-containing protein [Dehalococcoidia bacterium]|nr:methyltransferase domain-containing protein [Dehalococcoidia bacterium]
MASRLDRFQSIDPALLDIGAGDRVIDLGCGTGRHVLELAKSPGRLVGADLSSHDLRVGRYLLEIMRRDGEVRAEVHWLQSAGERLPFVDAAFDRVICTETLEHVDDDRVLAAELQRVLKPGGILAVSVPDEYSESIFWRLSTNYRTHVGGHVRIYRRPEIVRLLRGAGLEPYAVRYRHSLETLYWLSHVAFWSEWGQQGPITRVFRRALDSTRARQSAIITALDDVGNRILPKSIVVYSRKPLRARQTLANDEHEATAPGRNGHAPAGAPPPPDERTTVEVRAVPAPFEIATPSPATPDEAAGATMRAPLSLRDELRLALTLDAEAQKARLLEILRSCRFTFMREVQGLDGEQAATPWTADGRSMKEIIGHIAGWETWTAAACDEIAAGSAEPAMMSLSGYPHGIGRYASIDTFNAARMAEARERPWAELLASSDATFGALLAAVERTPAAALAQTASFFWPDVGGTVPCGVYLLMVAAYHYQEEHLAEVRRA